MERAARERLDGMESDSGSLWRACNLCPKSFAGWYSLRGHLEVV